MLVQRFSPRRDPQSDRCIELVCSQAARLMLGFMEHTSQTTTFEWLQWGFQALDLCLCVSPKYPGTKPVYHSSFFNSWLNLATGKLHRTQPLSLVIFVHPGALWADSALQCRLRLLGKIRDFQAMVWDGSRKVRELLMHFWCIFAKYRNLTSVAKIGETYTKYSKSVLLRRNPWIYWYCRLRATSIDINYLFDSRDYPSINRNKVGPHRWVCWFRFTCIQLELSISTTSPAIHSCS